MAPRLRSTGMGTVSCTNAWPGSERRLATFSVTRARPPRFLMLRSARARQPAGLAEGCGGCDARALGAVLVEDEAVPAVVLRVVAAAA